MQAQGAKALYPLSGDFEMPLCHGGLSRLVESFQLWFHLVGPGRAFKFSSLADHCNFESPCERSAVNGRDRLAHISAISTYRNTSEHEKIQLLLSLHDFFH